MADKAINIAIEATSMRTCLGNKAETLEAMHNNVSGLKYSDLYKMYAGLCDVEVIDGYTRFESMLIEQVANVLTQQPQVSLSDKNCKLIIATTKGNVDLLAKDCEHLHDDVFLYESAKRIAGYFDSANRPVVISNACISGVSAFVVARDMLISQNCTQVIVAGCDILCEFITSGFASFKSIGSLPCRPYDEHRDGLTLGEAAAAVLLTSEDFRNECDRIYLGGGAISNDANHISGPSRTGDGLYYAIRNAMQEAGVCNSDVGFVNTHGTATRYNDEMESKAIAWAELTDKPLNSIKGYIGHTLGASGVVETIVCAEELKKGYIYGTRNFTISDTSHRLAVSSHHRPFSGRCCIKTSSGFGGCNAAIVLDTVPGDRCCDKTHRNSRMAAEYSLPYSTTPFAEYIRTAFKSFARSDIKFYKMSDMSKALYVSVERLLAQESLEDTEPVRRAIVLANKSSSLDSDIMHQQILNQKLPEGASPAVFVYTLANVAAGEMCIRHKIQGDNTFFIDDDAQAAERYAHHLIEKNRADAVICGWCEYLKGKWNINIKLLKSN